MADLVIRGMEIPKTCCQCDLKIYNPELRWDENGIEQIGAWICKRTREIIWNTQRGENCPLLPLPEGHGRLIDADALIREGADISDGYWVGEYCEATEWGYSTKMIENAPTIVPKEVRTNVPKTDSPPQKA